MKMYIVDAFEEEVFSGNTAAVCVTESWMSEEKMQKFEMNELKYQEVLLSMQ